MCIYTDKFHLLTRELEYRPSIDRDLVLGIFAELALSSHDKFHSTAINADRAVRETLQGL